MNHKNVDKTDENLTDLYVRAFAQQLRALRDSARWKIGHKLVSIIERLLGRQPTTLAIDHLDAMIAQFTSKASNPSNDSQISIPSSIKRFQNSHGLLKCAFVVSDTNWKEAVQGDIFTALELAEECKKQFGWECTLVDQKTADKKSFDILISLLFEFDISVFDHSIKRVAWVRSYAEYWIMKPWFNEFDIVLCSSKKILNFIELTTSKPAYLFPIATNTSRFKKGSYKDNLASDYCFIANRWTEQRTIEKQLQPKLINHDLSVYGRGWQKTELFSMHYKGQLQYENIPDVYASSKLVLDDSNDSTTKWESVNSRIFDVLGMGQKILTNNTKGVTSLFDNYFPSYQDGESLHRQINGILSGEKSYADTYDALQKEVLAQHTYAKRASTLNNIIEFNYGKKFEIALKISASEMKSIESWGDYHFAVSLANTLRKYGHHVRIDRKPEWYSSPNTEEINIVLRGVHDFNPPKENVNILWVISHPASVTKQELQSFDHIFASSALLVEKLAKLTKSPVSKLLQCTDTSIFFPDSIAELPVYKKLYVANSRKVERRSVQFAKEKEMPIDIIGSDWKGLAPDAWIKESYASNQILRHFYSTADVVINDHWDDMKEYGIISNRIFDALACGAQVLSDEIQGDWDFNKFVNTYDSATEFRQALVSLERKNVNQEAVDVIRENHTFDHRVSEILDIITTLKKL